MMDLGRVGGCGERGSERRCVPRWCDKRLVVLQIGGGECPGITGDISAHGMRVGLPRPLHHVGSEVRATIAFAQELMEVVGQLVYMREGDGEVHAGIQFDPLQEEFSRFVSRRYVARPA